MVEFLQLLHTLLKFQDICNELLSNCVNFGCGRRSWVNVFLENSQQQKHRCKEDKLHHWYLWSKLSKLFFDFRSEEFKLPAFLLYLEKLLSVWKTMGSFFFEFYPRQLQEPFCLLVKLNACSLRFLLYHLHFHQLFTLPRRIEIENWIGGNAKYRVFERQTIFFFFNIN